VNLFQNVIHIESGEELAVLRCAIDPYIEYLESFSRSETTEEIYQYALNVRRVLQSPQ
jgi:hypothetical protein